MSDANSFGHTAKKVIRGHTIETRFIYPPIPDRQFDWEATFKGFDLGDLIGRGPTESSAVSDLLQQESERE